MATTKTPQLYDNVFLPKQTHHGWSRNRKQQQNQLGIGGQTRDDWHYRNGLSWGTERPGFGGLTERLFNKIPILKNEKTVYIVVWARDPLHCIGRGKLSAICAGLWKLHVGKLVDFRIEIDATSLSRIRRHLWCRNGRCVVKPFEFLELFYGLGYSITSFLLDYKSHEPNDFDFDQALFCPKSNPIILPYAYS